MAAERERRKREKRARARETDAWADNKRWGEQTEERKKEDKNPHSQLHYVLSWKKDSGKKHTQ